MNTSKAHCNICSGLKNHGILHSAETRWDNDEQNISGGDKYETLKCLGCDSIKLRHTSWFSENEEDEVNHFPPAIFRKLPDWLTSLNILPVDEQFVNVLLKEIYVALQNNLPNLAAMGVRSLIEKVMISKSGDQGTFTKNLKAFENEGYVSRIQRERIEAILDAGHATIHRKFTPTAQDVLTLVDITEHVIETVYLHGDLIKELKQRVPPRKQQS